MAGWMPFTAVGGIVDPETESRVPYGAAGEIGYAVLVGLALLALAMAAVKRRDL
ncbi:hypothetical protein [Actinomadura sp. WMMA1423]|uniref:hypothetical protein n=1 Tax=Actinomadura sp. WMMA1423 TaxID=2591108 RepID=UPI00143D213E|nr:hypothetical protein [Actinomadura sp. WMMA1423]